MSISSLFLICFTLIALFTTVSAQKCFVDVNYKIIKTNDVIVGVKSYFTLFVWRSLYVSSGQPLENVDFSQQLGNEQLLTNWIDQLTEPLLLGVEFNYYTLLESTISSLSINKTKLVIKKIYLTDELCRGSNLFEELDALFLEPFKFAYFVRIYREHSGRRKPTTEFINSNDFYPFRIMASNLTIIDRKACPSDQNVIDDLSRSFDLYSTFIYSLGNYSCQNQPQYYDNQHLRIFSGVSNFTDRDIDLLQNITGIKVQYTRVYLDQLSKERNLQIYSSLDQILLPSSCHFCSATLCPEYHLNNDEYWSIGQVGIIAIYFFVFFISGSFKSPVFTQRLALSYGPILSGLIMVFFSKNVGSYCFAVFHLLSLWLCLWFVLLFTFTMARLVYMRNMYKITKNSKNIRLHKIISSAWFGLLISLVILPLISLGTTVYGISMFFMDNNSIGLFRNSFLLALLFGGCVVGLISVFFDMFLNRRNIKEKGFLKFLFFDDPFLVRLELLLLVMLLLVGLWTVVTTLIPGSFNIPNRLLNILVALFTTLACGGNALIVELLKKVIFRKKFNLEEDSLDHLLVNNQDLYDLFKEYCSKEFSLENILFFDKLRNSSSNFTRTDAKVRMEIMNEWINDFFTPYGKYELNLPSNVRKRVFDLVQKTKPSANSTAELLQVEQQTILVSHIHEIVIVDLLMNLNDTFSRLQRTREFQRWKEVYNYKEKKTNN